MIHKARNYCQHLCQGDLLYWPKFYPAQQASQTFERLLIDLNWQQGEISMFGKKVAIPRLQAWYGDDNAHYKYSGLLLEPEPWHHVLAQIKQDLEHHLTLTFNSVLCNLYRHGQDSMGWHSDNEKQLGEQPNIASLSFGQCRKFYIRHKVSGEKQQIDLQSGSLLLMRNQFQQHWQHSVPKSAKPMQQRINLTFRNICYPIKS
ncbi:alpha-ketoglutarate-dependent dioxygenase AlkB [Thalassotalea aquiviva]|uniref:alpha-ketoglutarate-dependent dioxygenase AlkB family protein n=1 Tax=Thalassotalea aquiviva TaxID=3242415 RepID=UPI003529D6CB